MLLTNNKSRHFGMDLVRFIAIISVLISHGLIFFYPYYNVESLIYLAIFGVELFFGLSGFLIGNILINLNRQKQSLKSTTVFWFRRWMRTIPAYLVVAVIIMLANEKLYLSYFVFLQNIYPEQLKAFQVSWTLTIEEWFYLLFPTVMLIFSVAFKYSNVNKDMVVISTSLLFIFSAFFLRLNMIDSDLLWDEGVRKQIQLRLDGIAFGVILALCYNKKPQWFNNNTLVLIQPLTLLMLFAGIWWSYIKYINIFTDKPTVFNAIIFYPLINILSVLIVAYFVRFSSCKSYFISRAIQFISVISYSLYLVHYPIYIWCSKYANSPTSAWIYFVTSIFIIFFAAVILYTLVESPFIIIRNKLTDNSIAQTN